MKVFIVCLIFSCCHEISGKNSHSQLIAIASASLFALERDVLPHCTECIAFLHHIPVESFR